MFWLLQLSATGLFVSSPFYFFSSFDSFVVVGLFNFQEVSF